MTAQIINFTERRRSLLARRDPFPFWTLFASYLFMSAVSYGAFVSVINNEKK